MASKAKNSGRSKSTKKVGRMAYFVALFKSGKTGLKAFKATPKRVAELRRPTTKRSGYRYELLAAASGESIATIKRMEREANGGPIYVGKGTPKIGAGSLKAAAKAKRNSKRNSRAKSGSKRVKVSAK